MYAQLLVEKISINCTLTKCQDQFQALVNETDKVSALRKLMFYLLGPFFLKKINQMNCLTLRYSRDCDFFCSINFPTISLSYSKTFPLHAFYMCIHLHYTQRKFIGGYVKQTNSQNRVNK